MMRPITNAFTARSGNLFLKILFALLLLFGFYGAQAQTPVQISTQLIPPYSVRLSDYYMGTSPRIIVTLVNRDLQRNGLRVRLRLSVRGVTNGIELRTRETAVFPFVSLDGGIPAQLSLGDIAPYFQLDNLDFSGFTKAEYQRLGKLPDDAYTFCFEAVEALSGKVVSSKECAYAIIQRNEPPLLNMPARNTVVKLKEPMNMVFSWTPRHQGSIGAGNEYKFQLLELWDKTINPQSAFDTRPALYEVTTSGTSLLYGPAQPLLLPGKTYAWRVKASKTNQFNESETFGNEGYSEVYAFQTDVECNPVTAPAIDVLNGGANIIWPAVAGISAYTVEYKYAGESTTTKIPVTTASASLLQLASGKEVMFRIINDCGAASNYFSFRVPGESTIDGKAYWSHTFAYGTAGTLPLVTNGNAAGKTERTTSLQMADGKLRYPLNNISVIAYSTDAAGKAVKEIGRGWTTETGNYSVELDKNFRKGDPVLLATVNCGSQLLTADNNGRYVPIDFVERLSNFSFEPLIQTPVEKSGFSIDLFVRKNSWQLPYYRQMGLGNKNETISWGSVEYVYLDRITNGGPYNKLFRCFPGELPIVRLNAPDGSSSLSTIPTRDFITLNNTINVADSVTTIYMFNPFQSQFFPKVSGLVTVNGQVQKDAQVTLSAMTGDVMAGDASYTATTDKNGFYEFNSLGKFKVNATLTVTVNDKRINCCSPLDTKTFKNDLKSNRLDFNYEHRVSTIAGRVLFSDGQPAPNAVVTTFFNGNKYSSVKSSADGFFVAKVPEATGSQPLEIEYDGCQTKKLTYKTARLGSRIIMDAARWEQKISETDGTREYLKSKNQTLATADLMGLGSGKLADKYANFFLDQEQVQDVIGIGAQTLDMKRGTLSVSLVPGGGKVRLSISKKNSNAAPVSHVVSDNQPLSLNLDGGDYNVVVSINDIKDNPFPEIKSALTVPWNGTVAWTVKPQRSVKISGIVRDSKTKAVVDGADVKVDGTTYATKTDSKGYYVLDVPENKPYRIMFTRSFYTRKDTVVQLKTSGSVDVPFVKMALPAPKTLAGHPIQTDRIEYGNIETEFRITGSFMPAANGVFKTTDKLSFANITVKVKGDNAIPVANVPLTPAEIKVRLFGYLDAVLSGDISLRAIRKDGQAPSFEQGVVTGKNLKLMMNSTRSNGGVSMPIRLIAANIIMTDPGFSDVYSPAYAYPFVPAGFSTPKLRDDVTLGIQFPTTGNKVQEMPVAKGVSIFVNATGGTVDKGGVNLSGSVGLPQMSDVKAAKPGNILCQKIRISKDYIPEIVFATDGTKIATLQVQRFPIDITKIQLTDIGTNKANVKMEGWLSSKKDDKDPLEVKDLEIVGQPGSYSLKGNPMANKNGIVYKGLYYRPDSKVYEFAYNSAAKSYNLSSGAGKLGYENALNTGAKGFSKANTALLNMTLVSRSLQKFAVEGAPGTINVTTKANEFVKLKVFKLTLDKLLVDINPGTSKTRMDALMNGRSTPALSAGDPMIAFDESKMNWGIGVAGALSFDVPAVKAEAKGTYWFVNTNNNLDFDMNEVGLSAKAPGFEVGLYAKLTNTDYRQGFMGTGALRVGSKLDIDCGFSYYKLDSNGRSGISLSGDLAVGIDGKIKPEVEGLSLLQKLKMKAQEQIQKKMDVASNLSSLLTGGVTLGPVTVTRVGGGFSVNTQTNIYSAYILGDLAVTGVHKDIAMIENARVDIKLQTDQCDGWPTIDGSGSLKILTKEWAKANVKIDFCQKLFSADIRAQVPFLANVGTIDAGGLVYFLMPGGNNGSGSLFFGANAYANIANMVSGNVTLAYGVNFGLNQPGVPQYARDFLGRIDPVVSNYGTYMNAAYIGGDAGLDFETDRNISVAGLKVCSFGYSFRAAARARLFYKFDTREFLAGASFNADATGYASAAGFYISGAAGINMGMTGGYNDQRGWYFDGEASAYFKVYTKMGGLNYMPPCNSMVVREWMNNCRPETSAFKRLFDDNVNCDHHMDSFLCVCKNAKLKAKFSQKGKKDFTFDLW